MKERKEGEGGVTHCMGAKRKKNAIFCCEATATRVAFIFGCFFFLSSASHLGYEARFIHTLLSDAEFVSRQVEAHGLQHRGHGAPPCPAPRVDNCRRHKASPRKWKMRRCEMKSSIWLSGTSSSSF